MTLLWELSYVSRGRCSMSTPSNGYTRRPIEDRKLVGCAGSCSNGLFNGWRPYSPCQSLPSTHHLHQITGAHRNRLLEWFSIRYRGWSANYCRTNFMASHPTNLFCDCSKQELMDVQSDVCWLHEIYWNVTDIVCDDSPYGCFITWFYNGSVSADYD